MTGEILSAFSELGEIINWAANHHENSMARLSAASESGLSATP